MSAYLNYYGRNAEVGEPYQTLWGYTYLGPILIPPVPATFGMTDRNGTGQVWFLMWDGTNHLILTNQPPRAFAQAQGTSFGAVLPYGQNVTVFGPWDGPYIGTTGWRLGVTTAAETGDDIEKVRPAGTPRLQFDSPDNSAHGGFSAAGPPIIAPNVNSPQQQSYPEPSNFPASGAPTIPGIPSTTPAPTGGGLAAFTAAYQTNTPPLVLPAQVAFNGQVSWHLQHLGA